MSRRIDLAAARTSKVLREAARVLTDIDNELVVELLGRAVLLENAAENAETNDTPIYKACLREIWEIRS